MSEAFAPPTRESARSAQVFHPKEAVMHPPRAASPRATPLACALLFGLPALAPARLSARASVHDATGKRGMVVAVSPPGADVGRDVLVLGGNAVDAAVATAFAMAVTYPSAGNIGGGGFMLVHPPRGK